MTIIMKRWAEENMTVMASAVLFPLQKPESSSGGTWYHSSNHVRRWCTRHSMFPMRDFSEMGRKDNSQNNVPSFWGKTVLFFTFWVMTNPTSKIDFFKWRNVLSQFSICFWEDVDLYISHFSTFLAAPPECCFFTRSIHFFANLSYRDLCTDLKTSD